MTKLIQGKVCPPLGAGTEVPDSTQYRFSTCSSSSQVSISRQSIPGNTLLKLTVSVPDYNLCEDRLSVLYTIVSPGSSTIPGILPTSKHFPIVTAQKLLKGCIDYSRLLCSTPAILAFSKSFASYIHQHPGSLPSLKGCDCPIRSVLLNTFRSTKLCSTHHVHLTRVKWIN